MVDSVQTTENALATEKRVSRLETSVESLHAEVQSVGAKVDRLSGHLSASRGVNWKAVSIVMGAVVVASSLVGYVINDVKQDVTNHVALPGHPQVLTAMARVDEQINTSSARIVDLDKFATRLRDLIDAQRVWMDDNSNIDATQSEKIAEMEREHVRYRDSLGAIASSRWTNEDGQNNRDRIAHLEALIAGLSATVKSLNERINTETVRNEGRQ